MAFDMKKTASELLKIADAIEKEASEKTYFVCDKCNHTANLSSINSVRTKVASDNGIDNVNPVSVEDSIACPVMECAGVMRYAATEDSEKYYIDVEAGMEDDPFDMGDDENPEDSPEPEEAEPAGDKPADDSPFQPVDEQKAIDDEEETQEEPPGEIPAEEPPVGPSEENISDEVVEDTAEEEDPKPKPKKKKKDKADDEKAVPKFTEMPEDMKDVKMKAASNRFNQSVARYSNM
jgi:hypothetical protein